MILKIVRCGARSRVRTNKLLKKSWTLFPNDLDKDLADMIKCQMQHVNKRTH